MASTLASPAKSQDANDESDQRDGQEIVVTARKVEEPLRRVPFGITLIENPSDIRETRRFAKETPGLNFTEAGVRTANTTNIRGVGSFLPLSFEDSSVPVFVDGVPLPLGAIDLEFFDIERIEVLRGPQSTVFGRNAQAGAISITTKSPSQEGEFAVGFEVGNLGQYRAMGLASGPLSDTLAIRMALEYSDRDGDVPDVNLGGFARDQAVLNANTKLAWTPSDNTEATLGVRYGNYDEEPIQGLLLEDAEFPRLSLDTPTDLALETFGASLRINHDFGSVKLTSITAIEHYDGQLMVDDSDGLVFGALTGLPPIFFNDPNADFRSIMQGNTQFSQELRLTGKTAAGLVWIAGLEFLTTEANYDQLSNTTGVLFGEFRNNFSTDSYAAYAEATVPLTQRLQLIGGLRVTYEDKSFDASFDDLSGIGFDSFDTGERSFTLITGRASVTYDMTDAASLFATVARGAKSGGFQLIDTDLAFGFPNGTFDSATTWTYEIGSRGTILDGHISYGASIFFNDTTDEHIPVFQLVPFQGVVENLDTETYGAEIEMAIKPTDQLTFTGTLALLESEITDTEAIGVSSGNEVPFAPGVSYSLGAQYEFPLRLAQTDGTITANLQYQFTGSRRTEAENILKLDSFSIFNARIAWESEALSVYVFADNLFDEVYADSAFFIGPSATGANMSFGFPGRPRLYGIGAMLRFGGQ